MRKISTLIISAALLACSGAHAAPQIGQPAPAFTLTDSKGKSHALSDYRGKYVVLEWTNHDCPFVMKHYKSGNMQAHQKDAAMKGVAWLSIVSSAPGKQGHIDGAKADELTASRQAAPTAVLLDPSGEVGRQYGAKTTPHMYIVAPDGKLIYMGGIDSVPSSDAADIAQAKPYVKVALAEAMAGKPISEANTRPYGCAVKY